MTANVRALISKFSTLCSLTLLTVVLASGCGEAKVPTGKLTGKVTYKDAPVTAGTVTFRNDEKGVIAAGPLTDSGEYTLKFGGGLEVPADEYTVTVTPPEPHQPIASDTLKGDTAPAPKVAAPNIPAKYRSAATSGLKKMIDEGENSFDIALQD